MNLFSVEGKKVFLTGARGYLGSSIAEVLLKAGATVSSPQRHEFTPEGFNRLGPFDVIINNAHPMDWPPQSFFPMDKHLAALNWPLLSMGLIHDGGSIINVASMYALVAPSPKLYENTTYMNPVGYSVAKAGLLAMTRYMASFLGSRAIRVNALCPGAFPKPGVEESFRRRLADRTALGRVGRPEELHGAILFLASEASTYMTGQTLVIDGGWTTT